jgi:hypothetical protein
MTGRRARTLRLTHSLGNSTALWRQMAYRRLKAPHSRSRRSRQLLGD